MALSDLALSIMTLPQYWDGTQLTLNLLLLPASDPTAKLSTNGPIFAGTTFALEAIFIPSLENPPADNDPTAKNFTLTTPAPASAATLFTKLQTTYGPKVIPPSSLTNVIIRKVLPDTYLQTSGSGNSGSPYFAIGEEYGCAIRAKDPGVNTPPPTRDISWGGIISFALRQPKIATALGLLYPTLTITPDPKALVNGGWLYVRFVPATNPFALDLPGTPDLLRVFAARISPLTKERTLFAPVLFPLGTAANNASIFDDATTESQEFDDGFAKIVHTNQPTSVDAATGVDNTLTPATDAGIQIGWDDEQVTIWHNRQLDAARAATPDGLPLGVLGYRIDVRDVTLNTNWTCLCAGQSVIKFDPSVDGPVNIEQPLQPASIRALGGDTEAWLPRYFAQWRGKSLVAQDPIDYAFSGNTNPPASTMLTSLVPPNLLRYGHEYQLRGRLADITCGGPPIAKSPLNPSRAAIADTTFRRWIKPTRVRTSTTADPTNPATLTQIQVWRPIMGFPQFLFAGVDDSVAVSLAATVAAAKAANQTLGANDPDVDTLRIIVEARTLTNDTANPTSLDDNYRIIYSVDAPFPAFRDPVPAYPPDPIDAVTISLDYQDVADIADLTAPASSNPQAIPIPRARDVRIRLIAIANNAVANYFGDPSVQLGIESHLDTRSDAGTEQNLFDPSQLPVDQCKAILLQPALEAAQRLASALGLQVNGLTLSGLPGQRVVFGASGALRTSISGDGASLTLNTQSELFGHWLTALTLSLNRDWTWDGLAPSGLTITRDGNPSGVLQIPRTVIPSIGADPVATHDSTLLIFLDAIDPNPQPNSPSPFPQALNPSWTITPTLKPGLTLADAPLTCTLSLPKAAPPAQTPRIASAGIALSPYQPSSDYSSTAPRSKMLWLEFETPPQDPADIYFARVLQYAPDPLLTNGAFSANAVTTEPPDPPISLDPEPIRIITPGATADQSGLDAMTPLIAETAANPLRFLLPLPPGITADDPECFGFWTYELRVGHTGSGLADWSTAQARFGRPLRMTGVQHPAPQLKCTVFRNAIQTIGTAPFATPVRNGAPIRKEVYVRNQMWMLLYAQVTQADGASHRNVLLLVRAARLLTQAPPTHVIPSLGRDLYGIAIFTENDDPTNADPAERTGISTMLTTLGLPLNSPLSMLAVELLPTPSTDIQRPLDTNNAFAQQRILRTSALVPAPSVR